MKNQIVQDSVKAVCDQTGLDSRYVNDLAKLFSAAFDAGAASSSVVYKSAALTDAEIALLRAKL